MAIDKATLIEWLENLSDDACIGIDEGGLTLVAIGESCDNPDDESQWDSCIEIGGLPYSDE